MVVAALVTFAVLLVAWLLAPSRSVVTVVEPMEPGGAAAKGALAEAA